MLCVYFFLVICTALCGRAEDSFDFDHAFRKFQTYLESKAEPAPEGNEWYDDLVDRMGVAMGEEEDVETEDEMELMKLETDNKKGLAHHQFLRNMSSQKFECNKQEARKTQKKKR